jgi:hypothetical protein
MNSLFLKIFLWFWTAFVIVGMTLAVVVTITRSNATMLAGLSAYLPFEARQAADIYERDGKSALQWHFDHISEIGLAQPYLLDENWQDVYWAEGRQFRLSSLQRLREISLWSANSKDGRPLPLNKWPEKMDTNTLSW